VAKGLLFYYFPRKIDLLRTLFAERLSRIAYPASPGSQSRETWPARCSG
jgi:AcrR family transcriptional regulator